MTGFGVETIELDLPPLVGALSRRLHEAGLSVNPARSADFARALTLVQPVARRQLYWTARAVFVTESAQVPAFDEVFFSVFGGRGAGEEPELDEVNAVTTPPDQQRARARALGRRLGGSDRDAGASTTRTDAEDDPEREVPLPLATVEELLGQRRFDRLEPHELAALYRLMSQLELATPRRAVRAATRSIAAASESTSGERCAPASAPAALRSASRAAGGAIAPRRLVMLCDISGSMEPYARAYLQFLTCAAGSGPHAEAFVFATRLTRLTRALSSRNPERAIQRAAAAAPDWSSGTRIGDALREFNDRHGRRGMARGAVIVIISDGWERGDPKLVGRELERLGRLAQRIVWVNPRLSADAFSVQSGGMLAALPHCDALVSGHSFQALAEVVDAIGAESWEPPAVPAEAEAEEPWASATPVPGSSVAMPSGYGPSRGAPPRAGATDE